MVLMISIKTLKDLYLIDENLDDKFLITAIVRGQDFLIKPLLGNIKYSQLISDIDNKSISAEDNILLVDYIQNVLAYFVMSEVVYSTAYKFKNNPDYLNNPSASERFDEIIKISTHYLRASQQYEQILRNYIYSNGVVVESDDAIGTLNSGYETGLFID